MKTLRCKKKKKREKSLKYNENKFQSIHASMCKLLRVYTLHSDNTRINSWKQNAKKFKFVVVPSPQQKRNKKKISKLCL